MLSICIPIFNSSIVKLVAQLHTQCLECNIPFEIICLDDASDLFRIENKALNNMAGVRYEELPKNIGRASIRNRLAQKSNYEYILFLDSDVKLKDDKFISRYLKQLKSNTLSVIVGGVVYDDTVENMKQMHYKYGIARESKLAEVRNRNPYASFLTGNVLMSKKIFETVQFNENLKGYGHEDTLFCVELKQNKIPILHIDNPIVHEGVEQNNTFVIKQLNAVSNLCYLINKGYKLDGIKLVGFYLFMKKIYVLPLFLFVFSKVNFSIKKAFSEGRVSNLVLFDLLKLYEFSIGVKKVRT